MATFCMMTGGIAGWLLIGMISTAIFVYCTSRIDGSDTWGGDPIVYLFVILGPMILLVSLMVGIFIFLRDIAGGATLFDRFSELGAKHGRKA